MIKEGKHFYEFGPYRIDPEERLLLRGREPIRLPPKAFETLLILVNQSEKVVLKDYLMKSLWPDTFVEEANLSQNIFVLRKALGETAQDARYITTVAGRGYRFAQKVARVAGDESVQIESQTIRSVTVEEEGVAPTSEAAPGHPGRSRRRWLWVLTGAVVLAAVAVTAVIALRRATKPPMNEADLVLVTDFVNTTGEPVFDGALKQAVSVKLAESPYFNIAVDAATRQTLKLMARSPDEHVVPPIARDVCQREGAKVMITGTILRLGEKYILDLDATNCLTGAALAHQQIEAASQDNVLARLGQVIPPLRRKLGESLGSIQKFDTPIEQATTRSLPALKAYTTGDQYRSQGKDKESIPFYKTAIDLDPEFAVAYARLSAIYHNIQQPELAKQYIRKAYERREHVSQKEKFYIVAHYYDTEPEEAIKNYIQWIQAYPHDWVPFNNLSNTYIITGDNQKAVEAGQQALRLNPNHGFPYEALARAYQRSSRFAEAKAVCEKAEAGHFDNWTTHEILWDIAAFQGDEPEMQRQLDWYRGNPMETWIAYIQGAIWLSRGELQKSRAAFERSRSLAVARDMKEFAAEGLADEAQFEGDVGVSERTRPMANQSLRLEPDSVGVRLSAALALARAGDVHRAQELLDELNRRQDLDQVSRSTMIGGARAALALDRGDPAQAVEELRAAAPFDLRTTADGVTLYYRGLAYLELKNGKEAAAQFQKIIDNPGSTGVYWPIAHLGLARAEALTGDIDKSLAAYRAFLDLWKDADSGIPTIQLAKTEYARLGEDLHHLH